MNSNLLISLALLGWFVTLAVVELVCARREAAHERGSDARLLTNFTLTALVFLVGAVSPVTNVSASLVGERLGIGLGRHADVPWAAMLGLTLIAMTFASYWIHRLMHATPLLWRVHRVHHADSLVDVSTSLRNHPLELVITIPVSAAVVLLIGAPVSVVVAAQSILVGAVLWQHADIDLSQRVERLLSAVIVTPRLHRLHHNTERSTHDSNYGELIIVWDRLFGTLNLSEGRRPVGLNDQAARADRLLEQICWPLSPA